MVSIGTLKNLKSLRKKVQNRPVNYNLKFFSVDALSFQEHRREESQLEMKYLVRSLTLGVNKEKLTDDEKLLRKHFDAGWRN